MFRYRILLITALVVLLSISSAYAVLGPDKSLDKLVTLAVKGEALSDVMPMLEKQTGVRLRVGKEIADQKATVFVDDKPLRQVMEGLSTLFGYHWTKKTFSTGDTYELWQDEKSRQKLMDQRAKAWDAAWNAAIADIEFKAKVAAMSKEERDALCRELTDVGKADSPQVKSQLEALKWVDGDPLIGPTARLFCEMQADVRKMLAPGVEIKYNSLSPESEWVLPEHTARELLDVVVRTRGADALVNRGDVLSMGLQFSCADTDKAVNISATFSPAVRTAPKSTEVWRMGTWLTYQRVFEYLPSHSTDLPKVSDMSGLEKQVSITSEDIVREAGRGPAAETSPRVNRSDLLAVLHRKLGLQVISDHYSQWESWKVLGDTTALAIAKALDAPASSIPDNELHAAWGWDGNLLYMRTKDICYSDALEIPNRLLRRWASSYRDRGHLDLYEQAAIAALNFEQFMELERNREYLGMRKDARTGETSALRLFGLMSDKQQKEAFAAGTSAEGFTPEQAKALEVLLGRSIALPMMGSDGILTMPVGVWTDSPPQYRLDKPEAANPVAVAASVSVTEGSPSNPPRPIVVGGSLPPGVIISGGASSGNEGKPGDMNYTMVVSFSDGAPPMERGITIPGGDPDKPESGRPSAKTIGGNGE